MKTLSGTMSDFFDIPKVLLSKSDWYFENAQFGVSLYT